MSFLSENNTHLTHLICSFAEGNCTTAELQELSALNERVPTIRQQAMSGLRMHRMLQTLPKPKLSENFDSQMAAKFALELERETQHANQTHLADIGQLQAD
ncbi:MAG: hypothetical protein ACNA78_00070 [Balneolaceae bacterium]